MLSYENTISVLMALLFPGDHSDLTWKCELYFHRYEWVSGCVLFAFSILQIIDFWNDKRLNKYFVFFFFFSLLLALLLLVLVLVLVFCFRCNRDALNPLRSIDFAFSKGCSTNLWKFDEFLRCMSICSSYSMSNYWDRNGTHPLGNWLILPKKELWDGIKWTLVWGVSNVQTSSKCCILMIEIWLILVP